MSHLLMVELPGGNDTDIIEAALGRGDTFAFLTQDIYSYKKNPAIFKWVAQASDVIHSPSFSYSSIEASVLASHRQQPFDAILCLLDIRLIEASKLAKSLGLRYLNETSAALLRDKFNVRSKLKSHGIEQPEFKLATTNPEVMAAIDQVGLPLLMKPSDGYGSQNILVLENPEDLDLARETLQHVLPISSDYGLGVRSNDRLLIERYMHGTLIGCDTFTLNGQHQLLGIHEKLMFSPPSFAIRGGCFMPNLGEWKPLEAYIFSILDAVEFDCGATHIEIMLTDAGPRLIEINPRLVGAKLGRLIGHSLKRSIHSALIDLHLGIWPLQDLSPQEMQPAVSRWLTATTPCKLDHVRLPDWTHEGVKGFEILSKPGDNISFPFENSQRIGYVMTSCKSRQDAETLAEQFMADCHLVTDMDLQA